MTLLRHALVSVARLGGSLLALGPLVFAQGATPSDVAFAKSEAFLVKSAFGSAMASAKGIHPEEVRARQEAIILYRARSYDAALERALVAIQGGLRDELLLLHAVRASVWIQDTEAAEYCQGLLEDRLDVMTGDGAANLSWWADQVDGLSSWVDTMILQDAETAAVIRRSRTTTVSVFGTALGVLGLAAFFSSRKS